MLFYRGFYASSAEYRWLHSSSAVGLPGQEIVWSRSHSSNKHSCTIHLTGNAPVLLSAGVWMLSAREVTAKPFVPLCDLVRCCAIHGLCIFSSLLTEQTLDQPMGRSRLRSRLASLVCIKPMRVQHTSVSTDVLPKCRTQ